MDGQRGDAGPALEISIERPSDGLVVIAPAGELDLSTRDAFEDALTSAREKGAQALVIDLSSLLFMDSSGLRLLIDAWNESKLSDRKLSIVVPASGIVRRVLEISGCDTILPVVDRLDDAI